MDRPKNERSPIMGGGVLFVGVVNIVPLKLFQTFQEMDNVMTMDPTQVDVNTLRTVVGLFGQQQRWQEAQTWVGQILAAQPDFVEALNLFASLLMKNGDPTSALVTILRSLHIGETGASKTLFIKCLVQEGVRLTTPGVRDMLIRALSEPWVQPIALTNTGVALVKLDQTLGGMITRAAQSWPHILPPHTLFGATGLDILAGDALLHTLLVSSPVCDIAMERFLTMARHAMLDLADGSTHHQADMETVANFCSALARQCFINEYAFAWSQSEAEQAQKLRESLVAALEHAAPIPTLWPLVVAAYFPLHALPLADRLLEKSWGEPVNAVLRQQIREPAEERHYRATMPRLTPVDDRVSLLVQNQYEENPFPRWVLTAPSTSPMTINSLLRRKLPRASFQPLDKESAPDILIAGCGTGLQPIEAAQVFQNARVLAVDLSLASLGYAKRKSRELGLAHIDYAQADILHLGRCGRSFDLIESVGVLHHLADPMAGWRVLLSLLRPGGFMRVGFYSAVARRDIVRARAFIAERGYLPTPADIRRCRQDLMVADKSLGVAFILQYGDFFTVSECRDLLFHVQEHRLALTDIELFLRENDLQFLGFQIKEPLFQAYLQKFPDDRAGTNLGQWQVFENENPATFRETYHFWVQKRG